MPDKLINENLCANEERYTEEERQLLRDIAQLKGTLQRLNNYFGIFRMEAPSVL